MAWAPGLSVVIGLMSSCRMLASSGIGARHPTPHWHLATVPELSLRLLCRRWLYCGTAFLALHFLIFLYLRLW